MFLSFDTIETGSDSTSQLQHLSECLQNASLVSKVLLQVNWALTARAFLG